MWLSAQENQNDEARISVREIKIDINDKYDENENCNIYSIKLEEYKLDT